ncbi:valine--tRNA ligase [Loktanella sp. 3ANDIMAR09]|uniref:valine--tRNA ligase n=1 Tax=Loktanella sp. 3ANDIMAR09 TaxID=1225657 RepID=UPI0006F5593A|nr:valine--tRNA ligase [Loktanella sp. 3ANDIMAR09]KQI67580.1 valine--tRNA ligase [Loktanella sp. 3ANDIMAR09]
MALPKSFDPATREAELYRMWEESGAFKAGAGKRRDETFTIMLPPPNVTGVLHVGHAFNHTLMDILTRWKRMQGFDTLWQPGLDHAGIATQLVVEKDMAARGETRKRSEMPRDEFLARVWDWKKSSGGTIEDQARRLGDSMDWSRSAFTMSGAPNAPAGEKDGNFHDAVLKVFVEMYNKGLIYRGKRLVNWDPHFETAISDLEVENIEVDGHMWHFKYPLAGGETYTYVEKDEDGNVLFEEERDYISIATTRPETMLGDGAVAVHKDDARYAPIVGKLCEIPVGPKESRRLIPIITDPYPDMNFGSGAVKITGAHDFNDYEVAKRGGIPMYSLMDTRGAMRADGKPYAEEAATAQAIANGAQDFDEAMIAAMNLVPEAYRGLDRFEARKRVVEDITAEGLAVMVAPNDPRLGAAAEKLVAPEEGGEDRLDQLVPLVEPKKIMQPFGDRSKVVIEPMLTDQWFVDTARIVQPALDAVKDGRTTIIPDSGRKVYDHWLENIEPWCISRQLWWGHQIPVWYGPSKTEETGMGYHLTYNPKKIFCAASSAEVIALAKDYYGSEVEIEFSKFADYPARDGVIKVANPSASSVGSPGNMKTQKVTLGRDPDVLDTWFSSGLWPFGTLGWPDKTEALDRYFPGDVLITGQDILFFWVARMMMMSLSVMDDVPFHTVYLHQLVRDAKGEKMSKTKGNVIDPLTMVDTYGADALRMSNAAMASIGGVLKISEDRIGGYAKFVNKLWNAAKLAEMNGAFDAAAERPAPRQTVNRWIMAEVGQLRADVDAALTDYRFNDAASALYAFIWGRFCDWYLEFSKPLLMDGSDADKAETQATLAWTLDQCLILLHPIMPFVTEELWQQSRPRDQMLALTPWPEYTDLADADAVAEMNWVISLIEGIRSARAQLNVPAGLKIPVLQIEADEAAKTAQANNIAMIMRMARVDSIDTADTPPKGSLTVATKDATFALPLAGLIDVAAEKARLGKSLVKLEKEIKGLAGRANNPKFAESAPPEVVAETRANLAEREAEAAQLTTALDRLSELD